MCVLYFFLLFMECKWKNVKKDNVCVSCILLIKCDEKENKKESCVCVCVLLCCIYLIIYVVLRKKEYKMK